MSSIPIEMVDNFSLLTQNKINILDSLDQGIIVFDENLKIKYYNDYISKLFQIENRDEINVLILNLKEDIKYKNYSQYKKIPQTDLTNFFNRFNKKLEIISSNSENISKEFIKSKSTYIVKSFDTTILQKGKSYTPIKFQTTIPENKRNSIRIITEKSLRRKSSYTLKGFDLLNDIDYLINDNLEDYLSFFIRKGKENNLKTFRDYLTRIIQHSKKTRENISMNGSICDFNNYIMIAKYSKNDQILLIDFQKYIEKSLNFEEYIITIKDISANNFLIDSYEGYTNDKKFISTLCHELKTPLNSITNMINLIKDSVNNTNEEIQEITNDLYINSMFMVNTVNDFLDFFYLKSNNFELDLKNFDLIKLINEIAESYSVLAKRKSLKFQVEYDIDIPNTIVNDEGRIKQILYNLLNNSIRYTNKGEIIMSISNFDSKHIKISIQDTGIGIINEEIKYLGTLSKEQSNKNTSGFGLCISNLLANYLGNNNEIKYGIHLNTEINKGSRFWFLIQNLLSEKNVSFFDEDGNYIEKEYKTTGELINNAHNYFECHNLSPKFMDINIKNKEMDSSSYLSSSSEETSEQRIENNNLNICKCPIALIVDDNPFNLMVCKNLLNKFCIISDISNSGVEAIEKIKSIFNNESEFCKFCKFYKFIFMDIDMPIKNGYETTKELLPLFKNHGINCKIFALSAFNGKEDREKALESGMIDYLCKPLSKDNLINFFATHFSELKFVCQ